MNFQQQKSKQLGMKDNSSIGEWDSPIIELCNKINASSKYYTTSSCSGRIVLIKQVDKKQEGLFFYYRERVQATEKGKKNS